MLTGKTINQLNPLEQINDELNFPIQYGSKTYRLSFGQIKDNIIDQITGVTPTATLNTTPTPTPTGCNSGCRQYVIVNGGPLIIYLAYFDCDSVFQTTYVTGNTTIVICSKYFPDYNIPQNPTGDYLFDIITSGCCYTTSPTPTPTPTITPSITPSQTPDSGLQIVNCCSQQVIGYFSNSFISQNQLTPGTHYFTDLSNITGGTFSGDCYELKFSNINNLTEFTGYTNVSQMYDCQSCLNLTDPGYFDCSNCPTGYTWSPYTGNTCISISITGATSPTGQTVPIIAFWDDFLEYTTQSSLCGHVTPFTYMGTMIFDPGYDINGNGVYSLLPNPIGVGLWGSYVGGNYLTGSMAMIGPLQRSGIWLSVDNPPVFGGSISTWSYENSINVYGRWFGITDTIFSTGQTFYVGIEGPSYAFRLNGETIFVTDIFSGFTTNSTYTNNLNAIEEQNQSTWKIYPVYFPTGNNVIEVLVANVSGAGQKPVFGCEIYKNTYQEITSFTAFTQLNVVFSTINRSLRISQYPTTTVPSINCFDTVYPICYTMDYTNIPYNYGLNYVQCNGPLSGWSPMNASYQLAAGSSGTTPENLFTYWNFGAFTLITQPVQPFNFTVNLPNPNNFFDNFSPYGYSCPDGYYYDGSNNICIKIDFCQSGQTLSGFTCVTPTPTPTPLPPTPTPTSYSGVCAIVCSSNCGIVTATTSSFVNGRPSFSFSFTPPLPSNCYNVTGYSIQWDGVKWVLIEFTNSPQYGSGSMVVSVLLNTGPLPIGSSNQWVSTNFTCLCAMDTSNFYTYGLYNNCPTPTQTPTPTNTPTQSPCLSDCKEWFYNNLNPFNITLNYFDCYSGQQTTILSAFTSGYTDCILNNPWHNTLPPNSTLVLQQTGNCCYISPTPTTTPTLTPTQTVPVSPTPTPTNKG